MVARAVLEPQTPRENLTANAKKGLPHVAANADVRRPSCSNASLTH